jgi:hypothetical protein
MISKDDNEYIVKTGVVAMLDLLGIGSLSSEACVDLLYCRDAIVRSIEDHDLKKLIPTLDIYQFGDTILFCIEVERKSVAAYDVYRPLTFFLNHLVTEWLDKGFLIRGAVAYGDYVLPSLKSAGSATIIGPAVAEVARWYEAIDWAGVVIVPSCSELVKGSLQKLLPTTINPDGRPGWFPVDYIQYDAPVADGECNSKRLWCLAWPFELRNTATKKIQSKHEEHARIIAVLEALRDRVNLEDKAKEAKIKAKYDNTIEFVRHCGTGILDILPEATQFYKDRNIVLDN